jgi:CO dehydrogenase maturation factor
LKLSIAIAGKGGTGKTTLAALLVRALSQKGVRPILAVDADPNSTLADALGVDEGTHLSEIREQGSSPEGSPSSGVGRVRAVEDEIHRAITEAEGFDLVTMGRGEGPRCYCYVNNLLRKSLGTLSKNYDAVIVDNEAGMEHLSRRTTSDVDVLVTVLNPTMPSLRAARRILELSRELPVNIRHRVLLVTRVEPDGIAETIDSQLAEFDVRRLADIPQDDAVERAGALGQDVFSLPEDNRAVAAVQSIVEDLCAITS